MPYASIGEPTLARLTSLLDPGLEPANPLDIWGTGDDAQRQLAGSLVALADDPAVAVVALAVDLVREFDGDRSYPAAVLAAAARTAKPVAVLTNVASAVDHELAGELRAAGIPVLEGMRTGLLALRHPARSGQPGRPGQVRPARWLPGGGRAGWRPDEHAARAARRCWRLTRLPGRPLLDLLREYGIAAARTEWPAGIDAVLAAPPRSATRSC